MASIPQALVPRKPERKDHFRKKEPKGPNLNTLEGLMLQIQKLQKNLANPKDKEKYLELKERHYREFLARVNKSNGYELKFPIGSFSPYKYYIGRGNNSILVRGALKQRFWWSMGDFDEWSDYNFIWTQWKSNKVIAGIKTHKEVLKDCEDPEKSLASTQASEKESGSSSENLTHTPKRSTKNTLQALVRKAQEPTPSASKEKNILQTTPFRSGVSAPRKLNEKGESEKEENVTQHDKTTTNH